MSIVNVEQTEGPGVILKENGKFKFSSYSPSPVPAYSNSGKKLSEFEAEIRYKELHQGISPAIICASYTNSGKKLSRDEAKIRDEANEFFFKHTRNLTNFRGDINRSKPNIFNRIWRKIIGKI